MKIPMVYDQFIHQAKLMLSPESLKKYALFWEQGAGKSKAAIDYLLWLMFNEGVNGFLILAPPGCYDDWTSIGRPNKGHLEDHLPPSIMKDTTMLTYEAGKASSKRALRERDTLLSGGGLKVLCMTFPGFYTKGGQAFAKAFLKKYKVFYIIDESRGIKAPSGKQSNAIVGSSKLADFKWIMTGTPASNGPMDVWKQIRFIDPEFWTPYGLKNFSSFKHTFGVWQTGISENGRPFEYCVAYKNLELLHDLLKKISDRVLTEEVVELPPKTYKKHMFQLTPKQRDVYDMMEKEHITFLKGGGIVTAPLALTRILRLVQITSNYLPEDDTKMETLIDDKCNPRMEAFMARIKDIPGKRIVWAEFNMDVDLIMERLGKQAVRYDGQVTKPKRLENEDRFKSDKDITTLVSKQSVGGKGKNWQYASSMFYYNCQADLEKRLQSERRNWRPGAKHHVFYHDFVAEGTRDEIHVERLITKKGNQDIILGDLR